MFGTDNGMDEAMYRNQFRWLETADESFDSWGYPGQGRWEIYGLDLPDPVLEKIYHLNAERMFQPVQGRESREGRNDNEHAGCTDRVVSSTSSPADAGFCSQPLCSLLSAGCTPSTGEDGTRGAGATIPDQGGSEAGRPDRADHEFGRVPDSALRLHTGIAAQGRPEAHARRSQRAGGSDLLVQDGKPVQFALDLGQAKVQDSVGKLGRGKRVEISAHSADAAASSIQRTFRSKSMTTFPTSCFPVRNTRTPAPEISTSTA